MWNLAPGEIFENMLQLKRTIEEYYNGIECHNM